MKHHTSPWRAPLVAAGAVLLFSALPAAAAPAQSFGNLKPLAIEQGSNVQQVWHRGWHRRHCHWVKRCWIGKWGHRRCAWVRRCR